MQLFTPGHIQFDSYIERAKYLMVYRMTLLLTLVLLILTLIYYNVELFALVSYLVALIVGAISLIYLLLTQRYRNLFLFYAITGTVVAHFSCNFSATTSHYVDFLWMMVASLLAFVGMGRKWGLIILTANAVGISYFIFFTHNQHIAAIKPFTTAEAVGAYLELLMAIFILAYLMYQFIAFQNYSEAKLRRANIELADQNTIILSKNLENATLLKEIHHRVKNNLQIVVSLLRLQQADISNPGTREHFSEAINRVMVMASIHQRLYREKEVSKIDLSAYIADLANDLKEVFRQDHAINVEINCSIPVIDLKTVVPLGLLLNELISNSYKYAFDEKKSGTISIRIEEENETFVMQYADTGVWKTTSNNKGFGLELIRILAEQLNGKYEFNTGDNGTQYRFVLSKLA
jgi:two-component system, sensor histidine kinase PdtaS